MKYYAVKTSNGISNKRNKEQDTLFEPLLPVWYRAHIDERYHLNCLMSSNKYSAGPGQYACIWLTPKISLLSKQSNSPQVHPLSSTSSSTLSPADLPMQLVENQSLIYQKVGS